jgi:hypothetical protein
MFILNAQKHTRYPEEDVVCLLLCCDSVAQALTCVDVWQCKVPSAPLLRPLSHAICGAGELVHMTVDG